MLLRTVLVATLYTLTAPTAQAAPGDLDSNFGASGYVVLAGAGASAEAVCLDTQQRIVVGARRNLTGTTTDTQGYLLRLSSSGVLDSAFGGWRAIGVASQLQQMPSILCAGDRYAAATLQSNGGGSYGVRLDLVPQTGSGATSMLLNQGLTTTNPRVALTSPISNRWLVGPGNGANAILQRWDGASAPLSFQGNWVGPAGATVRYTEAYTDASGNVFAIGRGSNTSVYALISSFNSAGQLRASFGTNGTRNWDTAADDYGQRITPSNFGGKLYIGLTEITVDPITTLATYGARIVRLNSNGSTDLGFGTGGNGLLIAGAVLGDIVEDATGRLIIVGKANGVAFVRRVQAQGVADLSFGPGGERVYGFGSLGARFTGVTLDSLGKIVIVGQRNAAVRNGVNLAEAAIVARLLP